MKMFETHEREKAIVVGLVTSKTHRGVARENLDELVLLTDTAGAEVYTKIFQERDRIDPATFIGSGKAREIGDLVQQEKINLVIFDDDLSAVQVRNLEKVIPCKIVDRTGLILDIFAARAKTKEAMTQVELAQLQYMMSRLTRQWTHLSKQYGGVGTKGPGETQIETDRRAIRTRISHLKKKLDEIDKERTVQRQGRKELVRVAMVGYTNAGKSTLLRFLSGADVLVEDRLFATLDTTVRQVELGNSHKILLSDTVGFIRKLPSHLIASFKSTLAEATEADLLLHIIDISHPQFRDHIAVVDSTLADLGASGKQTVRVFNKIDKLPDRSIIAELDAETENAVFISASRGINIPNLEAMIVAMIENDTIEETVSFNQSEYGMIAQLHELGEVLEKKYKGNEVLVHFRVGKKNMERLQKLLARRVSREE